MSTTLRAELTKAGCNVASATIIFQDGVGHRKGIGVPDVSPTTYNGVSTTGGTDPRLDQPFAIRQDAVAPRCVALDTNFIYVWVALPSRRPYFRAIPITAAAYTTGNTLIPIIADF